MNKSFWNDLPRPFFCLAPMADVTDVVYRSIIAKYSRHKEEGGGPDVFWTEFVSADGLCHENRLSSTSKGTSLGGGALKRDLEFSENERPIVAQLFSSNPENMRKVSKMCAEMGFSGIDINMGCPDRSIEKQGCGSAMIKTPNIAKKIIQAVKDGIKDAGSDIPVSVKTRVGYYKDEIDTWIPFLLEQNIACLSVHARTRKELSKVPADWSRIKKIVAIRNKMKVDTLIVGNGDVRDLAHAKRLAKETGADGIMIGRAVFGNPWIFDRNRNMENKNSLWKKIVRRARQFFGKKNRWWLDIKNTVPTDEKLNVLVEHAELFEKKLGDIKNFAIMKKHFKAYVNGFSGSKKLRIELMQANSAQDVVRIVDNFLENNKVV